MHALVEIFAGMIAALAAAALGQLGYDVTPTEKAEQREVRRTSQGRAADAPPAMQVQAPPRDC